MLGYGQGRGTIAGPTRVALVIGAVALGVSLAGCAHPCGSGLPLARPSRCLIGNLLRYRLGDFCGKTSMKRDICVGG